MEALSTFAISLGVCSERLLCTPSHAVSVETQLGHWSSVQQTSAEQRISYPSELPEQFLGVKVASQSEPSRTSVLPFQTVRTAHQLLPDAVHVHVHIY